MTGMISTLTNSQLVTPRIEYSALPVEMKIYRLALKRIVTQSMQVTGWMV